MEVEHPKYITPRWVLRNVEAPSDESRVWTCRSCRLVFESPEDILLHMAHKAYHRSHIPAFCCLHCAEAHHTQDGVEKHMEKHSTITRPQKSTTVCISVAIADTHLSHQNYHDTARRHRHMIAQDPQTGATLPVYSGDKLGEIHRLLLRLRLVILRG